MVSVALVPALLGLSVLLLPDRRRSHWTIVGAVLIVMAKFYGHELILGQVNLLFAVLVAGGILAMRRSRDSLAAALFVAAVVVKPYAVLFLPWLVFTRGGRPLGTVTLGAICAAVAPVGLYGFAGTIALHRAWWTTVTDSTVPNLTNPGNVSVAAMFAKTLGNTSFAPLLATAMSLLLLVIACVVVARGKGIEHRESLEGALLLTLVPLLSPQGWDYVFLLSTLAVMLLVNYASELPRPMRIGTTVALCLIAFSIFDIMGRPAYQRFMRLSIITVSYLVVIGALVVLRQRRVA